MKVTVYPSDAADRRVAWKSSNPNYAVVSSNGGRWYEKVRKNKDQDYQIGKKLKIRIKAEFCLCYCERSEQ